MNDGGPAFPINSAQLDESGAYTVLKPGMSLRDWFAGQALASMAHPQDIGEPKISATLAYAVADAMLAAREKGQSDG